MKRLFQESVYAKKYISLKQSASPKKKEFKHKVTAKKNEEQILANKAHLLLFFY